jgi:adenosylcobinamide-GDP ribazoletransferase
MSGLRTAVSFLTRVPVSAEIHGEGAIARSLPWFPVVGAAVGLVTGGVYLVMSEVAPPLVSALVAVACATYATGAFHEDGLADVADAFGGSFGTEEALRIMKDPTHGSFGVLALVLSVGLRVATIAVLPPLHAVAVLPAAHALSRAMAVQLLRLPSVGATGLGASHSSAASHGSLIAVGAVGLGVGLLFSGLAALPFTVACIPGALYVGWLARRKIGGITGDVLGAAQQLAELSVLVVAFSVTYTSFDPVWWA